MIYEPREDSFLLRKFVIKFVRGKVLDMGSGSGIQAIAARKKTDDVLAADINKGAVKLLEEKGIKSCHSDLFSNIKGKFDFIIFNPPYLPEDPLEDKDSRLATTGGKKGYELIEKFLHDAKKHLNSNGKILLLFSSLTGPVVELFEKYDYKYLLLEEKKIFFEILDVYLLTL
ncbi:MAG: HemK2/MTQ2 family protein methyltransferase [Nanoarchaeota archaeon]|nr:HemK2/MTQ2 family protein methyltransferase [Nanoarchaeota archaeon]